MSKPAASSNTIESAPAPPSSGSPSKRPVFLRAKWLSVLVASWEVDPCLLASHVPLGTELDMHHGKTYVSLVAFLFRDLRACGLPILTHRSFGEINLRFYVRRYEPCAERGVEVRSGVSFLREYVPSRLIVAAARWSYREPYRRLPIRTTIGRQDQHCQLSLAWQTASGQQRIAFAADDHYNHPQPGSADQFLVDRFWGYTRFSAAVTSEYYVHHPAWRVVRPRSLELDFDPAALFGTTWGSPLSRPPAHCAIADGSPVAISFPRRITAPVRADLRALAESTTPVPA
ncbi:MAG: DUF2071 domain-containing protein [Planctomycetota bacterium]|nr:MAG: DUF2071 domain-containing protein [Planctomycetota bacterium]